MRALQPRKKKHRGFFFIDSFLLRPCSETLVELHYKRAVNWRTVGTVVAFSVFAIGHLAFWTPPEMLGPLFGWLGIAAMVTLLMMPILVLAGFYYCRRASVTLGIDLDAREVVRTAWGESTRRMDLDDGSVVALHSRWHRQQRDKGSSHWLHHFVVRIVHLGEQPLATGKKELQQQIVDKLKDEGVQHPLNQLFGKRHHSSAATYAELLGEALDSSSVDVSNRYEPMPEGA